MIITTLTYCPTASAAPSAATYSLFPITYSLNYAFSAKERDAETGLSYFGARYYSSDLSIWLAVDPMSDKYPSLSPYVYCADNPVRCVDPNGEDYEVVVNDVDKTITIKATYYAANETDYNKLQKGLRSWNDQSDLYSLKTDKGKYSIKIELKGVFDKDAFNDAMRDSNEPRGHDKNAFIISSDYNYSNGDRGVTRNGHVCYIKPDAPERTIIHEIGHTLGLGEFSGDDVMKSGGDSDKVTKQHVMCILDFADINCTGSYSGGCQLTQSNSVVEKKGYESLSGTIR